MVGVNRAPVRIHNSGRARDLGHDIFEKEDLIKIIKRASRIQFELTIRVGSEKGCYNGHYIDYVEKHT